MYSCSSTNPTVGKFAASQQQKKKKKLHRAKDLKKETVLKRVYKKSRHLFLKLKHINICNVLYYIVTTAPCDCCVAFKASFWVLKTGSTKRFVIVLSSLCIFQANVAMEASWTRVALWRPKEASTRTAALLSSLLITTCTRKQQHWPLRPHSACCWISGTPSATQPSSGQSN